MSCAKPYNKSIDLTAGGRPGICLRKSRAGSASTIQKIAFGVPFLVLTNCAYYPTNHGPIAASPKNSITVVSNVNWSAPAVQAYEDAVYKRYVSFISATKNYREGDFHLSPSVFYLGFGMGLGYIYRNSTVISLFSGASFLPTSLGSGLSLSQAIGDKVFLNYKINYAEFHKMDCAFTCSMGDVGEFEVFHSFGTGVLFNKFFLDAHNNIFNRIISDPKIGITFGYHSSGD